MLAVTKLIFQCDSDILIDEEYLSKLIEKFDFDGINDSSFICSHKRHIFC